jgi:hypothetical protein
MRLDARSLAPLLLVTLVALMVILTFAVVWSAADRVLPEIGSAVEQVGAY